MMDNKYNAFQMRLQQLLEENLSNENFGIQDLCKTIGISRMQLHRKIKAFGNVSTSIFIRNYRLEKAKSLIRESDNNISQVAHKVGFKDAAYFCRCFKKYYNVPPRRYKSMLRKLT